MAKERLTRGTGASPGTATGAVVFRAEDALAFAARGQPVVFVRIDTNSDDVPGMQAAAGIMTTRGGLTGDAAIVARTLGKPCIASCSQVHVDYTKDRMTVWRDGQEDVVVGKGDVITIDGATGEIFLG